LRSLLRIAYEGDFMKSDSLVYIVSQIDEVGKMRGGWAGANGTGGLLVLMVSGRLTVGASGTLTSIGANGGNVYSASYYASVEEVLVVDIFLYSTIVLLGH